MAVHDRFGLDRGSVRVPGLLATKSIPFKRDLELWRLRTTLQFESAQKRDPEQPTYHWNFGARSAGQRGSPRNRPQHACTQLICYQSQ